MKGIKQNWDALTFSLVIAIAAYIFGMKVPIIGGPAFAIIIGILITNLKLKPAIEEIKFNKSSKMLLAVSLSLLGFGLHLNKIFEIGSDSLQVMIFTLAAAFITAYLAGRWLKISYNLTSLIGVGTGICGGSAIMALAPVIKAEDNEISYAISTIFLYNLAAVFIFPPIGHLLGLSSDGFALWAGTAINDTSSVLAAAYSYGEETGDSAAVVKLTRTTFIVPVCLVFALLTARKSNTNSFKAAIFALPPFIIYFLIASILATFNIIPNSWSINLSHIAKFMIVWSLAAVGLSSNLNKMKQNGFRPFILGMIVWLAISVTALIAQYLTNNW